MDKGNWVAIDKRAIHGLPKTRPYSLVEALFSYQVDLDNDTMKSLNEYARIWNWSRSKVTRFLRLNASIPVDNLKARQRPIKFRIIKKIADCKNQPETTQRPDEDQTKTTTIDPNPNPKYKEYFEILKSIPGYPFDAEKDFAFLNEKEKDYPSVDILSLLKGWKIYLFDVPLKRKSKPRSQLSNQFDLAMKWGKYKKAPGGASAAEKPPVNMLDIIKAAETGAGKEEADAVRA